MALENLGLSFLPPGNATDANAGPGGARLEDVIRILSFRLPRILGAKPIAPAELLSAPGGSALPSGGGTGGDPIADIIARSVLGNTPQMGTSNPLGSFAPAASPLPAPTQPPKPRIIPFEPGADDAGSGTTAGPNPLDRTDARDVRRTGSKYY